MTWAMTWPSMMLLYLLQSYEMKNQQMSLFQFYSYIDKSLHVSGLQAHPQENSHSWSHNHWFSGCTIRATCSVCTYRARGPKFPKVLTFVCNFQGAAVEDGRLKPGDRLLEVNGVDMTGKTQSEAVAVLRNAPQGSKVSIVVSRQEDSNTSPRLPRQIVRITVKIFLFLNSNILWLEWGVV
jgi:hypothetical protein